MARLANKSATQRAPQTSAAVPELPDFAAEFASLPGGQKTNASLQRWWDLVRQRIEFTNASNNGRMREFTRTIDGITGSITEIIEIQSDQEDYLEASWTIQAQAGPIVTGMKLFSATGPATEVSYIAFQADRFQVNTATGGNKQIFSASSTAVKMGDVLTVDLTNAKVFIGTGTYNNSNTAFYVDDDGYFSLKGKLSFDPTGTGTLTVDGNGTFTGTITAGAGAIGGWTINSTTLSKNNAILDSAGQLVLGTSNDVVYLSATDSTYRIWIGNATAGSASFRVSKAGVLTATNGVFTGTITSSSGTIAGFTLSGGSFTAGSGANKVSLANSPSAAFVAGNDAIGSGPNIIIGSSLYSLQGSNGATVCRMSVSGTTGTIVASNSAGTDTITITGSTGFVVATNFSGGGAILTALNASNISSGTLNNAQLPSAISVTSLATANFFANSGATSVDFAGANLRGFSDAGRTTQTFRVDATNGDIYISNVRVVRARYGTPNPGGGTDPEGVWAAACLTYHGLGF